MNFFQQLFYSGFLTISILLLSIFVIVTGVGRILSVVFSDERSYWEEPAFRIVKGVFLLCISIADANSSFISAGPLALLSGRPYSYTVTVMMAKREVSDKSFWKDIELNAQALSDCKGKALDGSHRGEASVTAVFAACEAQYQAAGEAMDRREDELDKAAKAAIVED